MTTANETTSNGIAYNTFEEWFNSLDAGRQDEFHDESKWAFAEAAFEAGKKLAAKGTATEDHGETL